MTKRDLKKTLARNLLLTFLISTLLTMFLLEMVYHPNTSETEGRTAMLIMVIGSVFWNLLLSLTAVTTFFNLNDMIRQSVYYRVITFFFLPVLLVMSVSISVDDRNGLFSFRLSMVSFFVVHLIFFFLFNRKIGKRGNHTLL